MQIAIAITDVEDDLEYETNPSDKEEFLYDEVDDDEDDSSLIRNDKEKGKAGFTRFEDSYEEDEGTFRVGEGEQEQSKEDEPFGVILAVFFHFMTFGLSAHVT